MVLVMLSKKMVLVLVMRYYIYYCGRLAAIHSRKVLYVFLTSELQLSIFVSVFSFSLFQNTSYCETKFLSKRSHFQSKINYIEIRVITFLKQLFFRKKIFCRTPSWPEQLPYSNLSERSSCSSHLGVLKKLFFKN